MAANFQLVCPNCQKINRVPQIKLADGAVCGSCRKQLFPGQPIKLTDDSLKRFVSKDQLPLLVDFWAPWCGPCKMMAPAFDQAAKKFEPRLRCFKLNTEEYPQAAAPYGIRGIPCLILFHKGKEINRVAGAMNQTQLNAWIEKAVA